jgi:hypothetical protein
MLHDVRSDVDALDILDNACLQFADSEFEATFNLCRTRKKFSIASISLSRSPGGPAMVSGVVRRLTSWASRIRKGKPPK